MKTKAITWLVGPTLGPKNNVVYGQFTYDLPTDQQFLPNELTIKVFNWAKKVENEETGKKLIKELKELAFSKDIFEMGVLKVNQTELT